MTEKPTTWRSELGSTGFIHFDKRPADGTKIIVPGLVLAKQTAQARLTFRFATGAIQGGHGKTYLDGVRLQSKSLSVKTIAP